MVGGFDIKAVVDEAAIRQALLCLDVIELTSELAIQKRRNAELEQRIAFLQGRGDTPE